MVFPTEATTRLWSPLHTGDVPVWSTCQLMLVHSKLAPSTSGPIAGHFWTTMFVNFASLSSFHQAERNKLYDYPLVFIRERTNLCHKMSKSSIFTWGHSRHAGVPIEKNFRKVLLFGTPIWPLHPLSSWCPGGNEWKPIGENDLQNRVSPKSTHTPKQIILERYCINRNWIELYMNDIFFA